jgi:hypothetical protein
MPPPQHKKFEDLAVGQQIDITKNLMPYAALTLMVFLRGNMGYRLVNPTWLWGVTVVEIVVSVFFHICWNATGPNLLFDFAVVSFVLGMIQRFKRKRELERGIRQHSFYIGNSRLHFSGLPEFFRRKRRVERFLDPIVCFIIGTILILVHQPLLGFWVAMSAACLRVFEAEVYEKEKNRNLDMVDSLIVSEGQAEVVEKFERPQAASPAAQRLDSHVPTGLADDIQDQIKRRKAKQPPTEKR